MAYYAFIDENNIVTEVLTGADESITIEGKSPEVWYGEQKGEVCKRTGKYDGYRKNFAGVGYTYDETRDAFIPPKPFPSWVLNEETCNWEAPVAMPNDGNPYSWNEDTQTWDEING